MEPVFLKDPNCGLSPRTFDIGESPIVKLGSDSIPGHSGSEFPGRINPSDMIKLRKLRFGGPKVS